MEKKSHTFLHALKLWLFWNALVDLSLVVVAVIGSVGLILVAPGLGYVYLPNIYLLPVPLSLVLGCFFSGLIQWFAFKGRIKYSYLWIWATALGWSLGAISLFVYTFTPEYVLNPDDFVYSIRWNLLAGATVGAVISLLQWLVIWRQVRGSGWWILGSVLGWVSFGCAIYFLSLTGIGYLYSVISLLSMGMITGIAYAYLFSQPSQKSEKTLFSTTKRVTMKGNTPLVAPMWLLLIGLCNGMIVISLLVPDAGIDEYTDYISIMPWICYALISTVLLFSSLWLFGRARNR